jgi:gamma-glutamylcyclotransferase (GGCT)/AIG2-like uncharacterized protein YtfP
MALWLRRRALWCGSAWFNGRLYDLGRYPGAVASARPGERVAGELYRLRRAANLRFLDRYEGAAYRRERGRVTVAGRLRACWIYLYIGAVPPARRIASGNWLERT